MLRVLTSKPVLYRKISPFHVAQVSQPSDERLYEVWDAYRCEIREPDGSRDGLGRRKFMSGDERGKRYNANKLPTPCMSGKEHSGG